MTLTTPSGGLQKIQEVKAEVPCRAGWEGVEGWGCHAATSFMGMGLVFGFRGRQLGCQVGSKLHDYIEEINMLYPPEIVQPGAKELWRLL